MREKRQAQIRKSCGQDMYLGSLHGLWIVNWKCLAITMVLDFADREKEETAACDVATLKYREGKAVTNLILHLQMVRSFASAA